MEYVDCILIHRPYTSSLYPKLLDLQKEGLIRHVGVSNFKINQLEELIEKYDVIPYMNQTELHLRNQKHKLIKYCRLKGIILQAHSIGCSNYIKTVKWLLSQQIQCVVGTINHMADNLSIYGDYGNIDNFEDGYCKFKKFS